MGHNLERRKCFRCCGCGGTQYSGNATMAAPLLASLLRSQPQLFEFPRCKAEERRIRHQLTNASKDPIKTKFFSLLDKKADEIPARIDEAQEYYGFDALSRSSQEDRLKGHLAQFSNLNLVGSFQFASYVR